MTATVIVFFHTAITAANEADFWQAGKYPLSAMHVQNVRQSAGEKTLKRHTKAAAPNEPAPPSFSRRAGTKREKERKERTKEKIERQRISIGGIMIILIIWHYVYVHYLAYINHIHPSIIIIVIMFIRYTTRRDAMTPLSRYEQETVVNYNAGEQTATVYTRDRTVMRKLDRLAADFPDTYKLIGQTDIDKTYSLPKSYVTYRKPRKISDGQREQARQMMMKQNELRK